MINQAPCGHLIENAQDDAASRCALGRTFPEDCRGCSAYEPGLTEQERTRCEVWTRVMGYHRPVTSFNAGKQSEHRERVSFREDGHG